MTEFPNRYYVDADGNYLGAFSGYIVEATDDAPRHMVYPPAPEGAIEVFTLPNHGLDKWNGSEWVPYTEIVEEPDAQD